MSDHWSNLEGKDVDGALVRGAAQPLVPAAEVDAVDSRLRFNIDFQWEIIFIFPKHSHLISSSPQLYQLDPEVKIMSSSWNQLHPSYVIHWIRLIEKYPTTFVLCPIF